MVTGPLHRGRLIHVQHKRLYAAIGQTDNRHRKPAELGRLIERILVLDAVLADRSVLWLGAEHDKRSHFQRRVGERLDVAAFPRLVFGDGPTKTVRYFPDKLPIGIRLHEDPVVFVYLVTRPAPFDFRLQPVRSRLHSWRPSTQPFGLHSRTHWRPLSARSPASWLRARSSSAYGVEASNSLLTHRLLILPIEPSRNCSPQSHPKRIKAQWPASTCVCLRG